MITICIGRNLFKYTTALNVSSKHGIYGIEFDEKDKSTLPFPGGTLNKDEVIRLRDFLNEILELEEKNTST